MPMPVRPDLLPRRRASFIAALESQSVQDRFDDGCDLFPRRLCIACRDQSEGVSSAIRPRPEFRRLTLLPDPAFPARDIWYISTSPLAQL